jgi:hypothetical protein
MRYIVLLCLIASNVFGQGQNRNIVAKRKFVNHDVYNDHRQMKITNHAHNTTSYNFPSSTYFDDTLSTFLTPPNGAIYYPCNTSAILDGKWEISKLIIYGPSNASGTFAISHGDSLTKLHADTTISLNYSGGLTVNMHNIQTRFLNFNLNAGQGPSEIQVFGKPISLDAIPARVFRPYKSFQQLTGFNGNSFIPLNIFPWDSCIFREYDFTFKLMNRATDTLFAFSPDYVQYKLLDDHYQEMKDSGNIVLPLFFQTPDSLYKASYINAGQDFNYNSAAVQYGADRTLPASYISKARLVYQAAARYGQTTVSAGNLKIDLPFNAPYGNTKRTATQLAKWWEPNNERDSWFNTYSDPFDPNKFDLPYQAIAELSALYDGHQNTMGPRVGVKNADPHFQLLHGAMADLNPGYLKHEYYWCKDHRTDRKVPFDIWNFHQYLTNRGGYDANDSRAICPELFTKRGQAGVGIKNDLYINTEFAHRYLPGKAIAYTEWGFDTDRESQVGIKLPTTAERALQPHPLNSWKYQGAFIIRTILEYMSCNYIDYSIMYEIANEDGYTRIDGELPDDVSDVNNNVDDFYSPYGGAIRYKTSGLTLSEFGFKPATSSSVNLSTLTNGTSITFALANPIPYTFASPIHVRANADDGTTQNAETIDGTITSQSNTSVTISVTGHTGTNAGRTEWRFDTPFLRKDSWYMYDNAYKALKDCKFVADSSTSTYRRYIFDNGTNRRIEAIWLPTQIGDQKTVTIYTSMTAVTFRDLESYSGATSTISLTGNHFTTTIYEVPKLFYHDY